MPCRSGSPQGVFNDAAAAGAVAVSAEACANAGATDSETAASAVVMATTIIEIANLSRMLISVCRGPSALLNYKGGASRMRCSCDSLDARPGEARNAGATSHL